jgi:hypothetical protein
MDMLSIFFLFSSQSHTRNHQDQEPFPQSLTLINIYPLPIIHSQTVKMMKIIIAALTLAATAFGAPAEGVQKRNVCTPATYSCTPNNAGWQVCDVTGAWDVSKPEILSERSCPGQNANSSSTVRRLLPTRHRLRFLPAQPLAILCASGLRHSIVNGLIHSSSFVRDWYGMELHILFC